MSARLLALTSCTLRPKRVTSRKDEKKVKSEHQKRSTVEIDRESA